MKKLFTLFTFALLGLVIAHAQSKIPGSLDLSTVVVDAGTGTLHEGAGWDGSKIDWMTKGNTATIQFENTKDGAKYKIVSYGGTNQSNVVVGFSILDSKGNVVYDETTEPYASGGFGDKKKNTSLPVTDAMASGVYTLILYYDNLDEEGTLEVNITQIDFIDADEYVEDTPSAGLGLNIPCTLDGSKAVITKNCTWGSTPSCDDDNCFNWVGDGDIITFAITNTKEAAYAISFDTATPCEPVTIDFLITDANGRTVYGQTANVVCTGETGGDWAFKPEGHNTSLPNTDVLPMGNYTLALTFHQGTNYENFTTNVKDIVFTAVSNGIELDMSKTVVEAGTGEKHGSAGWNGTNIDWMQNGNIAKIPFCIDKEDAYQIVFTAATICDNANVTTQILDANGNEVYNEKCIFENNNSFSDFIENKTLPATPTLKAGDYTMVLTYGQAMYGGQPTNVTINVASITLVAASNSGSGEESSDIYTWEAGTEKGGKATAQNGVDDTTAEDVTEKYIRLRGAKDFSTYTVTVTLDQELQAGDKLTVTAYRNKNQADKKSGVLAKFDKGGQICTSTGLEFVNINAEAPDDSNYGTEPNTVTFEIPTEAAGSKVITMTRAETSTNLFITKLQITRGGTTAIETIMPAKTSNDGYIYSLAGQRVDANYKGIVIKNGKKYLQK